MRVAFVYNETAAAQSIVVDGVVVKRCTGKIPFAGTGIVQLGRNWRGKISYAKIFNRALSTYEIEAGRICVHMHMHACMYLCTYVCMHMYVVGYICAHGYVCIFGYVRMYVDMRVRM